MGGRSDPPPQEEQAFRGRNENSAMLVGYVSDERYLALPDVQLEFEGDLTEPVEARSRANGAVYAAIPSGRYQVTLQTRGYGPKIVEAWIEPGKPRHFRLLSNALLGYVWPKWVKSGDRSEFRVHSLEAYKLEVWRYGWEKKLERIVGWYDEHGPRATMQITPDGDYTQSGVQWNRHGYTHPHHRQYIKAPERTGLYYFHARGESGDFFSFPWIVAPATPAAEIAVLASNISWNAYNNFGGRSNYIHPDRLPDLPTVNARLQLSRYSDPEHITYSGDDYAPLSFDRPEPINLIPEGTEVLDPIEGRSPCHLAPAEWRLLGWLEREGFPYDYYAETQFHFGDLDLDRYRVLIISTHPEYWSRDMYDRVKSWIFERGGRLLYLGGNGLNCEVELLDVSTMRVHNVSDRELRERKLESRFHLRHESEANLLGVVFTDTGIMTGAPYRVVDPSHWVFAGTGLKQGDLFGTCSLHMRCPGGASGHETDKVSASSPQETHLVAKGANPDNGGAEMVLIEKSGGGAVFSAGSVTYTSALLVDEGLSRITANVLNRFLQ